MTALSPEETLRHIHYKVACLELPRDVADKMIDLFEADSSLDYAALQAAALAREMPDVVFHTSLLRNRAGIDERGLRASNPAHGQYRSLLATRQPVGVYASAEPDRIGMWAGTAAVWDIWCIRQATSLPHRQDPLNPEHFVIECSVPRNMITFCGSASRNPRHTQLDIPPEGIRS